MHGSWTFAARLAVGAAVCGALAGCPNRGDKPVIDPQQKYLFAGDQALPTGIVGQSYDATLHLDGGEPPYEFTAADNKVPLGLTIDVDGHVRGVPAEAGSFSFAVNGADSAGRSTRIQATMQVVIEPITVACGDRVQGSFTGSAYGLDGPDLTDLENVAWIAVEMPDDLVTRVELQWDMLAPVSLFVELPGEVLGSGNLDDHYWPFYLNPGYTEMDVPIDAGTFPSLTGYLTQALLPTVLVAQAATDWTLRVECTDGPIFEDLPQYPTRLGDPLEIDYQVYGDNSNVRIWTEDPLPDWMIWDEATGRVTGTATEAGAWEFTIFAETEDGRKREERSIIGVYDVTDVACGESVPLVTSENYLDGEFYAFYDPRGYGVFRVPLTDVDASSITLEVAGADAHYLGLATPNPDWMRFYGGAERWYVEDSELQLKVDPRSYPAVKHYLDPTVGELYFSAGSIGSLLDMTVSVKCSHDPRPNFPDLPVLQPLDAVSIPLEGIGGTPPYTWSATDLPDGVALDPDGTLHGQAGIIDTYHPKLTIADKLGNSFDDKYTLYVGNDQACKGYTQMSCGDSVDGHFDEAYYNDGNAKTSTEVFCVVVPEDKNLGWEVYSDNGQLRVDVADPGRTAEEMFDENLGTYVNYVDFNSSIGVPIDPFSWPNVEDYRNLPLLFAVRAYIPGGWTVHMVCE